MHIMHAFSAHTSYSHTMCIVYFNSNQNPHMWSNANEIKLKNDIFSQTHQPKQCALSISIDQCTIV